MASSVVPTHVQGFLACRPQASQPASSPLDRNARLFGARASSSGESQREGRRNRRRSRASITKGSDFSGFPAEFDAADGSSRPQHSHQGGALRTSAGRASRAAPLRCSPLSSSELDLHPERLPQSQEAGDSPKAGSTALVDPAPSILASSTAAAASSQQAEAVTFIVTEPQALYEAAQCLAAIPLGSDEEQSAEQVWEAIAGDGAAAGLVLGPDSGVLVLEDPLSRGNTGATGSLLPPTWQLGQGELRASPRDLNEDVARAQGTLPSAAVDPEVILQSGVLNYLEKEEDLGGALTEELQERESATRSNEGQGSGAARAAGLGSASEVESRLHSGVEIGHVVESGILGRAREAWERSGAGPRVASIITFAGPALGIWLCSPLMSLIDTAVVGNGSSLELAALGPGSLVVDNLAFLFMFLSTATANLIATSIAEEKPSEASGHLQRLLFVAAVCGVGMLAFSEFCSAYFISGLAGPNQSIVPAACQYAKIRGLAWPAVLLTSVAQSASLALQDSWSPLICLSVASAINLSGDLILCRVFNLGIAGAAWATAASQYAACALMLFSIARNSKLKLGMAVPSASEFIHFVSLAGPIFLTLVSKVGFYTLVTYMATSLGTVSLAAHQVLIGIFAVCAVCAEPLSQTAQAFLPGLCVGAHRNLKEARALVQTLGSVSLVLGVLEAIAAAFVACTMPAVFTSDPAIAGAMREVVLPMCISLLLNPLVLAAEGVLLAGRDVRFLAISMGANVAVCGTLLVAASRSHIGLLANWWIVVLFQVARICQACRRIGSPHSIISQAHAHAA